MPSRLLKDPPRTVARTASPLDALAALHIVDPAAPAALEGLARLAALATGAPYAMVSLAEGERPWFRAACGYDLPDSPNVHPFCAHAMAGDELFEIEDASVDARFRDDPLVRGAPYLRAYAGMPLRGARGVVYGSLCISDTRPRRLDATQRAMVEELAGQAVAQLEHLHAQRDAELHATTLEQTLEAIPDAVVTCDADGILAEFNATARDWHGVDPRALPPDQWADHFDLFDASGEQRLATEAIPLLRAYTGEQVREQAIVIRARGQAPRTVMCNARRLLTPDGRPAGAVCIMYDVTAEHEALRAVAAERARLASVIEASRDVSIIATDPDGLITLFNSGAEQLLGYAAAEMVGRATPLAFHLASEVEARAAELGALHGAPVEGFDVFVRASRDGRVETREWTYVRKDGTHRRVRLSVSPLAGTEGVPAGFLGMAVDLTDQLAAERAARLAADRFSGAFHGAAQGMAIVDPAGRLTEVNDAFCSMLGYDREALQALTFHAITHPDDERESMSVRDDMLAGGAESLHVRKRYLHRDGHVVHAHLSLSLVRDATGAPVHFVAQVQDITRQCVAEAERDEADRRLRVITDHAPALIAYVDRTERFRFVNAAFRDWFGVRDEDVIGQSIAECRPPITRATIAPHLGRALSGERVTVELDIPHERLGPRTCQVTFIPDLAGGGHVRGCHVMAYDVSAQRALAQLMEQRALTDELTELPNRAAWTATLERTIAHARRAGEDVAMLFIDLDRFKAINDVHGHAAGDRVLCEFARRLREATRASDFAARLAGDEFVVLLHGVGPMEAPAGHLAERIRRGAAEGAVWDGERLTIDPSIGIAAQSTAELDAHRLMQAADAAMYAAKQARRSTQGRA